jgi:hypothetical protein
MLNALANRVEIDYLSFYDLTMTEFLAYAEWLEDCHYFINQA